MTTTRAGAAADAAAARRTPPSVDVDARLRDKAREAFGWAELRPGQLEAMREVMAGRDVLAVMPTGSGKSAIYQVPALLLDGPTVVVSPLIALQRDQVEALLNRQGDTGGAVALNSSRRDVDTDDLFQRLGSGDLEFVFLAPEQLAKPEVVQRLADAGVSLVVVDEAHCISAWGHDFRPDYLRLGGVVEALGHPPVLALTATASPPVRAEIVEQLHLRDPALVVRGFARPNLRLSVEQHRDDERKTEAVVERALTLPKPGIVYTATRKSSERLAAAVADLGMEARAYHAGMRAKDREDVHSRFSAGDVDVVCATTAFGMGIDKADVRFVLHAEVADSLDSYYQEVGRAGRDGEPAEAVLFYRQEDLGLRRFFAAGAPDTSALHRAAVLVAHAGRAVSPAELSEESGVPQTRLTTILDLLQSAGALELRPDGTAVAAPALASGELDPGAAVDAAVEVDANHRRVDQSRIDMMRGYAETDGCRRQYLLMYFGETLDEPCGRCDTCEAGTAQQAADDAESPFAVGGAVRHAAWGRGQVMRYEGDRVVVLFDDVGYKTLAIATVLERGLLEPV